VERALEEAAEARGDEEVYSAGSGLAGAAPDGGVGIGGGMRSGRSDSARHPRHVTQVGPLLVNIAHRLHAHGPKSVSDIGLHWREADDDAMVYNEGAAPGMVDGRRLVLVHESMRRRVFAKEGWAMKSNAAGSRWAARWVSLDRVT